MVIATWLRLRISKNMPSVCWRATYPKEQEEVLQGLLLQLTGMPNGYFLAFCDTYVTNSQLAEIGGGVIPATARMQMLVELLLAYLQLVEDYGLVKERAQISSLLSDLAELGQEGALVPYDQVPFVVDGASSTRGARHNHRIACARPIAGFARRYRFEDAKRCRCGQARGIPQRPQVGVRRGTSTTAQNILCRSRQMRTNGSPRYS